MKNTSFEFFKKFTTKHPEITAIGFLAIMCYFFLFFGINFYPLIDVDETRYAIMARDLVNSLDMNVLLLNGVPFLEKPPLYFWMVGHSINIFKEFSEFSVRFPIALLTTLFIFGNYYFSKAVVSRKFGVLSSSIILTSAFFLMLSHIAILDIVLTVFIASSLYCGFLTHFCQDRYKKYAWWGFYTFAGLGFLAKGILAFAISMAVMLIFNFLTKSIKEIFKPQNFVIGMLIFLAIITPWHMHMYKIFGNDFIVQYFIYHHFARLIDSAHIGRKRPLLYFIPVFIGAFLPWCLIFLGFIINFTKKSIARFKVAQGNITTKLTSCTLNTSIENQLLIFSAISFIVIFGVMSISSTKLPTYILPAIPFAGLLTAYYCCNSKAYPNNEKVAKISSIIFGSIFVLAGLFMPLSSFFLPEEIQMYTLNFKTISAIGACLVAIYIAVQLRSKDIFASIKSHIVIMFFAIIFCQVYVFNLIYNGGQNELTRYSQIARNIHNSSLVTFDFAVKPSIKTHYQDIVYFITDNNFNALSKILRNNSKSKDIVLVVVKNKNVKEKNYQTFLDNNLKLVEEGKHYSLYSNKDLSKLIGKNLLLKLNLLQNN